MQITFPWNSLRQPIYRRTKIIYSLAFHTVSLGNALLFEYFIKIKLMSWEISLHLLKIKWFIFSCGYFCNFVTRGTNFHKLFPGIRSRVVSLTYHFYIPFYRELVLAWGAMSAKYESIMNALSQSTNENAPHNLRDGYRSTAVVISVGGAQESLFSHPGRYRIYIKKRKGFIKAVLQSGSSLVPVFSFGEGNHN